MKVVKARLFQFCIHSLCYCFKAVIKIDLMMCLKSLRHAFIQFYKTKTGDIRHCSVIALCVFVFSD